MRIIDRLAKYLAHKKISAYAFERTCMVANGYLKKQLKGKGSIGSDILQRVYRNYLDLDFEWLLNGEGEMLRQYDESGNLLGDPRPHYSKDEMLQLLGARISLLETALADKEKIIVLLESMRPSPAPVTAPVPAEQEQPELKP